MKTKTWNSPSHHEINNLKCELSKLTERETSLVGIEQDHIHQSIRSMHHQYRMIRFAVFELGRKNCRFMANRSQENIKRNWNRLNKSIELACSQYD